MSDFDCTRFQAWLDDGGAAVPAVGPVAAEEAAAHAAACEPCAAALRAEETMLAMLAVAPPVAATIPPAGFGDRVLARVARTPQERPHAPVFAPALRPDLLPWWIRATAQPAAALALALAGIAVWFAPQLEGAGESVPRWGAELLATLAGVAAPWITPLTAYLGRSPLVDAGIALALLPLVGVLFFGLYRLGHLVATPRAFRT